MSSRRTFLAAAIVLAAPLARAQAGSKPIRLIVPYAPGGPLDATSRALAEQVSHTLGTVIIDNKPGAGGNIGMDHVARAAPDGLTLGVAAVATIAINPWLYRKMPYDAARDFAPITEVARVPNVLVMNAEAARRLNIGTLADLIAHAKKNPGQLNYGSGGSGSAGHLAGEMFKQQAGIFAVHIPYNGANPSQLALLAGQVDFTIDNLAAAAPNIKAGKLTPLAVTAAARSPLLPGVPAMAETLKGFQIDTWWGLVAPASTPPEAIARLNAAFTAALKTPETAQRFALLLAEPMPTTPEQFGAFMNAERARYKEVVRRSGAVVD
ncbi:MAG: tripartite tricarboxylate transporter substrate binding protein [Burkholderiaceae bacterium]|nr:tripartite tricarboxylate transporter substrate binding protein [Burkholderiaceae bacterium]